MKVIEKEINKEIKETKKEKEQYMRVTQRLLSYLCEVESELQDIVDEGVELNIEYTTEEGNTITFRKRKFRFGSGYIRKYNIRVNTRYIPEKTEDIGVEYSPFGDFSNHAQYMGGKEILDLANNLQHIVQQIKNEIVSLREKSEKVVAAVVGGGNW